MPAGRPPKPTELKKLEGTYRADRAVVNEMMPSRLVAPPSAPEYLTEGAKLEWESVCDELLSLNMLHRVDLALLSAYCQEFDRYVEASGYLLREGSVICLERPDGSVYSMPSPWVAIKNGALKNAMSIASQFGFTPSARTKIKGEGGKEKDPFEEFLRMDE
jgi:P27 family predicted phage terminase small subunit